MSDIQPLVTGQSGALAGVATADDNLDVSKLPPERAAKVREIAAQINLSDSQALMQYGLGAQSKLSAFADSILEKVRTKDTGYVGDTLTHLMISIKDLNVDAVTSPKSGFLGGLFHSFVDAAQAFVARYEKIDLQIEKIVNDLDSARMDLLKDVGIFDTMFQKNLDYINDLDLYIIAGTLKLKELNERTIPELKALADTSKNPLDAQKVNDLTQLANRFEKKIYDLKLTRMSAIQRAPQIRLIQGGDQLLVDKIQTSILNTIPIWKDQIIIAIGLLRQQKALKMQQKVTDTTNELLQKNSEMLKTNTLEVARESERGIIDLETLKKVNADLISTIDETIRIQQEGRTRRQQAEAELAKMEDELKQKLLSTR